MKKFFRQRSIRVKLVVAFSIIAFLIAVFSVRMYYTLMKIDRIERSTLHSFALAQEISKIKLNIYAYVIHTKEFAKAEDKDQFNLVLQNNTPLHKNIIFNLNDLKREVAKWKGAYRVHKDTISQIFKSVKTHYIHANKNTFEEIKQQKIYFFTKEKEAYQKALKEEISNAEYEEIKAELHSLIDRDIHKLIEEIKLSLERQILALNEIEKIAEMIIKKSIPRTRMIGFSLKS